MTNGAPGITPELIDRLTSLTDALDRRIDSAIARSDGTVVKGNFGVNAKFGNAYQKAGDEYAVEEKRLNALFNSGSITPESHKRQLENADRTRRKAMDKFF